MAQKPDKKESGKHSSTLIDPDHMSVLGAVNTKSPEKVVKEKQKTKKSNPSQSCIYKYLKALDAKWCERFSRLEVMLVAKTLEKPAEPTLQPV